MNCMMRQRAATERRPPSAQLKRLDMIVDSRLARLFSLFLSLVAFKSTTKLGSMPRTFEPPCV
jgi:hypothetical protein